jgi:hypothetical protein
LIAAVTGRGYIASLLTRDSVCGIIDDVKVSLR